MMFACIFADRRLIVVYIIEMHTACYALCQRRDFRANVDVYCYVFCRPRNGSNPYPTRNPIPTRILRPSAI